MRHDRINRRQFNKRALAVAAMAAAPITFVAPSAAVGCSLMISMRDDRHGRKYMRGDVINVRPGDPICGRIESFDVWVKEGLQGICTYKDAKGKKFKHIAHHQTADNWPGFFQIVYLPTVSPLTANRYALEGDTARRLWRVDLDALKALATSSRDQHKLVIDREARLVHAAFSMKPGVQIKPKPVKPTVVWGVVEPVVRPMVVA